MKEIGLYMSIMSGTLLFITMLICFLKVYKLSKDNIEELPEEESSTIKLKSSIFYCLGFSLMFWIAAFDVVITSLVGMVFGAICSIILSDLCPRLCKKLLTTLNELRKSGRCIKFFEYLDNKIKTLS